MAAPAVTITDVTYVAAPPGALPSTSEPPVIKLNAMEALWVVLPPLRHLLLFEFHDDEHLPPFDAILHSLRYSLSATLATHAPLAGKLDYLADTGDVAMICRSDDHDHGGGVRFVAAECDADVRRLAGAENHDVLLFERLVPELDMSQLPAPLLAAQATRLAGGSGGVALGVTVHHAVADGRSLWSFVEAWATACRGDTDTPPPPPVFDRSRVSLPGGDELARSVLRKYAPDLPVVRSMTMIQEDRLRFTRRTFTVDFQHIQRLKQRIVCLANEAQHATPHALRRPPSSFAAVVALAWTCFVRSRGLATDDEDDVYVFFFADARDRLDPPTGADYFGTCLTGCIARLPARELLHGEGALVAAAAAVQGAVDKMAEDPLGGCWPGWEFLRIAEDQALIRRFERLMNVSGSPGFTAYEVADFGWGRPRRTENVRMNHDGQLALVRARDGDGVQASVSMLRREHVDAFQSELLKLLG